jgi:hypothetical protein
MLLLRYLKIEVRAYSNTKSFDKIKYYAISDNIEIILNLLCNI